jgi:hypothetical protein
MLAPPPHNATCWPAQPAGPLCIERYAAHLGGVYGLRLEALEAIAGPLDIADPHIMCARPPTEPHSLWLCTSGAASQAKTAD